MAPMTPLLSAKKISALTASAVIGFVDEATVTIDDRPSTIDDVAPSGDTEKPQTFGLAKPVTELPTPASAGVGHASGLDRSAVSLILPPHPAVRVSSKGRP